MNAAAGDPGVPPGCPGRLEEQVREQAHHDNDSDDDDDDAMSTEEEVVEEEDNQAAAPPPPPPPGLGDWLAHLDLARPPPPVVRAALPAALPAIMAAVGEPRIPRRRGQRTRRMNGERVRRALALQEEEPPLFFGESRALEGVEPPPRRSHLLAPDVQPLLPTAAGGASALLHGRIAQLRVGASTSDGRREACWKAVEELCRSRPHEVLRLDRRGRSCLHAACAKKPPLSVVQALLEAVAAAAPGTNNVPDLLLERDRHGRTPLQIAVNSNADFDVISLLLSSCPQAATVQDHLGATPLHSACAGYDHGQEELVRLLLEANPQDARRESYSGRTPLHAAIDARAPIAVVRQLLELCPDAVVMDGCGVNPLFVAIRHNADAEIIRSMVRACPSCVLTRDRGNGLPLRRALENQSPLAVQECLCASAEIVLDADETVRNTALHVALEAGSAREATVELLLRTAPSIALAENRAHKHPLLLACQRWQRMKDHRRRDEERHMWRIVGRLMRAAYYNRRDTRNLPTLHAALALDVPFGVVSRALDAYPAEVQTRDPTGRYPLEIALGDFPQAGWARGAAMTNKSARVKALLDLSPAISSLQTGQGELPLSLAAKARYLDLAALEKLTAANCEALLELNPVHQLYPFQLAALSKEPPVHWDEKEDLEQVRSIYSLLRQAPQLVRSNVESIGTRTNHQS